MRIIVDAMGGDNAPGEIIKGSLEAAAQYDCDITLVGIYDDVNRIISSITGSNRNLQDKIEIIDASEIISFDDDPATVIRYKKNSSMVVALNLLRDGKGDALVSAGNTGALLSGSTLIVKRIRGIRRAALAPFIPNASSGFILIDCGANSDCTPEYLLQFAYMGYYYAQDILSVDNPRIGLLNNGIEATKGTGLQIETYNMLTEASSEGRLNFIGNIEPTDVMRGNCDVLVCDGFTGNILLKAIEGTAKLILSELKSAFYTNLITKISALMVKKQLTILKNKMNPDTIGGTILLGISKPVIKAHGSSNAKAVKAAINQAIFAAKINTSARLTENIESFKLFSK